jgi:hypothetical protein
MASHTHSIYSFSSNLESHTTKNLQPNTTNPLSTNQKHNLKHTTKMVFSRLAHLASCAIVIDFASYLKSYLANQTTPGSIEDQLIHATKTQKLQAAALKTQEEALKLLQQKLDKFNNPPSCRIIENQPLPWGIKYIFFPIMGTVIVYFLSFLLFMLAGEVGSWYEEKYPGRHIPKWVRYSMEQAKKEAKERAAREENEINRILRLVEETMDMVVDKKIAKENDATAPIAAETWDTAGPEEEWDVPVPSNTNEELDFEDWETEYCACDCHPTSNTTLVHSSSW